MVTLTQVVAASWGEAHTLGKPFEHRTDETADELWEVRHKGIKGDS